MKLKNPIELLVVLFVGVVIFAALAEPLAAQRAATDTSAWNPATTALFDYVLTRPIVLFLLFIIAVVVAVAQQK